MIIIKKTLPFVVILFLLLTIKGSVGSILNSLQNENTKDNLERKLADEKRRNKFLNEKLFYVKTDQFIEGEAKEKLGMLKPGEFFVIAPTPAPLNSTDTEIDASPNWIKWLNLFL
jgi:cell division protein FtsB